MDAGFRDWVVARVKKEKGEEKDAFIRMLKFQPDVAERFARAKLQAWMSGFVTETGNALITPDFTADSKNLIKHLQKQFAKDIESVK
jgi:hypothetical protein